MNANTEYDEMDEFYRNVSGMREAAKRLERATKRTAPKRGRDVFGDN